MKTSLVIIPLFIFSCAHKPNTTLTTDSTPDEVSSERTIDRNSVRMAMRQALPDFKDCYVATFKGEAEYPKGKINLTWEIHENGIVHYAHINEDASTIRNKNLEGCMLGVLQKIQMPPPPTGTIAEVAGYPFVFEGQSAQK